MSALCCPRQGGRVQERHALQVCLSRPQQSAKGQGLHVSFFSTKKRAPQGVREKIVQVKMQLRDEATSLAVRELTGIIASAPSWKYFPDQMTPGLTVPVVRPCWRRLSGVSKANSTSGISRSNGGCNPTSFTCSCK